METLREFTFWCLRFRKLKQGFRRRDRGELIAPERQGAKEVFPSVLRLFAGLASLQTSCYSIRERYFTFLRSIRPHQQFKSHHLPSPAETGGAGTDGCLDKEPDSPAACATALPRAPPVLPSRGAAQPRAPVPAREGHRGRLRGSPRSHRSARLPSVSPQQVDFLPAARGIWS